MTTIDISPDPGESNEELRNRASFLASVSGIAFASDRAGVHVKPAPAASKQQKASHAERILSQSTCATANAMLEDYAHYIPSCAGMLSNMLNTVDTIPESLRTRASFKALRDHLNAFCETLNKSETPEPSTSLKQAIDLATTFDKEMETIRNKSLELGDLMQQAESDLLSAAQSPSDKATFRKAFERCSDQLFEFFRLHVIASDIMAARGPDESPHR